MPSLGSPIFTREFGDNNDDDVSTQTNVHSPAGFLIFIYVFMSLGGLFILVGGICGIVSVRRDRWTLSSINSAANDSWLGGSPQTTRSRTRWRLNLRLPTLRWPSVSLFRRTRRVPARPAPAIAPIAPARSSRSNLSSDGSAPSTPASESSISYPPAPPYARYNTPSERTLPPYQSRVPSPAAPPSPSLGTSSTICASSEDVESYPADETTHAHGSAVECAIAPTTSCPSYSPTSQIELPTTSTRSSVDSQPQPRTSAEGPSSCAQDT